MYQKLNKTSCSTYILKVTTPPPPPPPPPPRRKVILETSKVAFQDLLKAGSQYDAKQT